MALTPPPLPLGAARSESAPTERFRPRAVAEPIATRTQAPGREAAATDASASGAGVDESHEVVLQLPDVNARPAASRGGSLWIDLARSNAIFGVLLLLGVALIAYLIGGGGSEASTQDSPAKKAPTTWNSSDRSASLPAKRAGRLTPIQTFKTPREETQGSSPGEATEAPRGGQPQPTPVVPATNAGSANAPTTSPESTAPGESDPRRGFELPNDQGAPMFDRSRDDDMAHRGAAPSEATRRESTAAPVARLKGIIGKPEQSIEDERSRPSIH